MSENLNINGYTCATNEIYTALKEINLSETQLKSLDKNSDKIITEDELVEFVEEAEKEEEEGEKKEGEYSDDPTLNSLHAKYEQEMRNLTRHQHKIAYYRNLKKEAEVNMAQLPEDSDERSTMESRVSEIQGKIDSCTSEITQCVSNMANINFQIEEAEQKLQEQQEAANAQNTTETNTTN